MLVTASDLNCHLRALVSNYIRNSLFTCSPSARIRIVRDDPRKPERPEVQPEPGVVVLAQQLRVHLGHAVDGLGPLHAQVGRGVARGLRPEGADGAGHEDAEVVLLGELHHVVQA